MDVRQSPGTNARFTGAIPELYDLHPGPLLFEQYATDLTASSVASS